MTSLSLPVSTSKTKPRMASLCGMNGLALSRPIDWRTSCSASVNDSTAQGGLMPVSLHRGLEPVLGGLLHAAVGVVDQHDLAGAEQPLADGQRPYHVVGDYAAGVPDHVRLAVAQAEQREDPHPGVHAGDDRDMAGGPAGRR